MIRESFSEWDDCADTFDEQPDHGLRDPAVRQAWQRLLLPLLPPAPASIADIGCGTGSLAVLLGTAGYTVTGVDFSPRMIAAATAKAMAANVVVGFVVGDAADPPLDGQTFDVVLARHVLWAMSDVDDALRQWVQLLRSDGRLILIEGRWHTGVGLAARDVARSVRQLRTEVVLRQLPDPALWGGPISDERYVLVSRR